MPTPEMQNPWESPPFLLFLVATIFALSFVVWAIRRRSSRRRTESSETAPLVPVRDVLRCVSGCGEPATEPSPSLTRSRDSVFRRYFGAAPRYRRTVDRMAIPAYCHAHAHVADARLDKWIFDVRARATAFNSALAGEASRLVTELPAQVAEELSDDQKAAQQKRRPNNVRPIGTASTG